MMGAEQIEMFDVRAEFRYLHEVRQRHSKRELRAVHERAQVAADKFKESELELVYALQEADRLLVYRFLGYGSMKSYAILALKLSSAQAYIYSAVARKSAELPQMLRKIESGEITVSKAARLISVISKENQDEWLKLAASVSKNALEKAVAQANPKQATPEQATYVTGSRLKIEFGSNEEAYQNLRRAQDVESQNQGKCLSLEDVISVLTEFYLERRDPVRKADRAQARAKKKRSQEVSDQKSSAEDFGEGLALSSENSIETADDNSVEILNEILPEQKHSRSRSRDMNQNGHTIPTEIKHAVYARDRGCCQRREPDGSGCREERFIDIHHIIHRSQGGTDDLENLVTLCREHHRQMHL